MRWSTCNSLAVEPFYGKRLTDFLKKTNDAIQRLHANRAGFDEAAAAVRSADVSRLDFDSLFAFPALQAQIISILQEEVVVRRMLDEAWSMIWSELSKQADRLQKQLEAARAEVQAGLKSIGYRVQPHWINVHPRVQRLNNEVRSMRSRVNDRAAALENDGRLDEVIQQLEAIRDRAAAV